MTKEEVCKMEKRARGDRGHCWCSGDTAARRAALTGLHLPGETAALLKGAGIFPSIPVKHIFAQGNLGTAACKVSGWQRGSLWDLGPPTQVSFRSRALGNRRWPVYQGLLSQPWRYWESLL